MGERYKRRNQLETSILEISGVGSVLPGLENCSPASLIRVSIVSSGFLEVFERYRFIYISVGLVLKF